jgi:hypothetical protein
LLRLGVERDKSASDAIEALPKALGVRLIALSPASARVTQAVARARSVLTVSKVVP